MRITSAGTSPAEDLKMRQRRYVVSMTIRTLCFVGAVAVGDGWLRWVLVAGAVFLPYAAVVMANAPGGREDPFTPEAPRDHNSALPRGHTGP
jgi:Protein of unknown function (DUF3099)